MAKLAELRKKAKDAGVPKNLIIKAKTVEELQAVMDEHNGESKPRKKSAVAKKKHTAVAKKKNSKSTSKSKSASSKSSPARSRKSGTAKRTTAATTRGTDGPSGRHTLDGVDYAETDGWNPRAGSPPDRIVKLLKKHKGNRGKVFDALVGDVWEFVGKKMRDGSKRSKADAEQMLRYRISRTAFDFAVRTGQHEPSSNRVEYGTGGTGEGVFKRKGRNSKSSTARKSTSKGTPKRSSAKKSSAKRGSKSKSRARR